MLNSSQHSYPGHWGT